VYILKSNHACALGGKAFGKRVCSDFCERMYLFEATGVCVCVCSAEHVARSRVCFQAAKLRLLLVSICACGHENL
jgi:hypothetical protein